VSSSEPLIYVTEDAVVAVCALADAAAPFEVGGLIVGFATDKSVWITSFVEIELVQRRIGRFTIPAGATHPIIDSLRADDPRIGYLGDWHSHPADVGPSALDFSTLADLVLGPSGRHRLLGLVRRTSNAWEVGFWGMRRLCRPVRVAYELTGPLPLV
jgi:hypothetical protein